MGTSVEEGSSQLLQAVANATEEEVSGLFGHGAKVIIGQWGTYSCFVLTLCLERVELLNSAACPVAHFLLGSTFRVLGPGKRPSWSKMFLETHFLWAAQEVVSE